MMWLAVAAWCAVWLPLSLQQIVPAALPVSALCHVSQESMRVLPSTGFSRSVLASYLTTMTTGAAGPAPVPSVVGLEGCLILSFGLSLVWR